MLTHMHPSRIRFTCRTSSHIKGVGCPSSVSGPNPEPPSAQSPFACAGSYPSQRDVAHLVRGRYPSFVAHTDSCVRPKSSSPISLSLYGRSLQVAVSPCWKLALPDVISTICVKALGPVPRHVPHDLVRLSDRRTSASPPGSTGSAREMFPAMQLQQGLAFGVAVIRLCSGSLTR
jgi:hypothetical protein